MELDRELRDFAATIGALRAEIARVIVGQERVVEEILVCLLAGGHALIEGAPGLGKTPLVRTIARCLSLRFSRIQFTPDLMPADVTGTNVIVEDAQGRKGFEFQPGPIFGNVILADEINRATPKTQSALLEAMSEGRVTVERETYALPARFLVLASQNPHEYLGTFPLPESQLDRFEMSLRLGYPARAAERELRPSG